jgi:hypothetical protein
VSNDVDLAGKPLRKAGQTGRSGGRRSKKERQEASRATQEAHWARRVANSGSPLEALRVAVDRATTVALKKERRAAAALDAAKDTGDQAAIRSEQLRLEAVRAELRTEVIALTRALLAFAERHETIRV